MGVSGRDAGESQRQPATAYAAFLSSFQAEPAHQGKHRRAALPGTSVAHKRDERPATRCRHGDEPGRVRYGYARDSPWAPPGAAASRPLANGSQAHRSRTMHLVGPTIAERAVSRRHLGEHPARPRGRWRRGLRPTPTARGPAGTRSASCHAANGPACVHPACVACETMKVNSETDRPLWVDHAHAEHVLHVASTYTGPKLRKTQVDY